MKKPPSRRRARRQTPSDIEPLGVGLQVNPHLADWFPFEDQSVDVYEILLDAYAGSLDSPYLVMPGTFDVLEPLRRRAPLLAHSNYGGEFGFLPLEETAAMRRHVPFARAIGTPWIADHCFYGDASQAEMWSCPLQMSRAEVARLAPRAALLQEAYGVPLLHENAAYYFPFPGADLSEGEFLARLTEAAGTFLHLDLHNVYTNSINLPGYRSADFLSSLPLDRVVAIHIAGGSWARGVYHDWHDDRVPEPVWEMLEQVLRATRVKAVIVEYQGRAHHEDAPQLTTAAIDLIRADLERAASLWDRVYGPGRRHSTRATASEADDGR
jgi:uncharacterized protein (UPF0276 family)